MNIEKESNLDPTSDRAYRVQDIGLAGVLKKTRCHLIGDECFFNSPDESRACDVYVRALAGSRYNICESSGFGYHP